MARHRSGLLASWATAWLAGTVSFDLVLDAVTGGDAPHQVAGLPGAGEPVPLGWALTALRDRGARFARLVLPVPGDPRGLPGPGEFTRATLDTGEGVLAAGLGLVPTGGDGAGVRWTVYETAEPTPDPLTVAEAEADLDAALRDAARSLADLDAATWRPDVAGLVSQIRAPGPVPLPPGHAPRAVRLLSQADRLAGVIELADADAPGGAVAGWEARARDEALRPLRLAVRRARLAAYNAACC